MKYFILYSVFIITPFFSFAGKKDSLKDNKVYLSGGVTIAHLLPLNHMTVEAPGGMDRVYLDWTNHQYFSLKGGIEWRKWCLYIEEGFTTGRLEANYLMENLDGVVSDYGDVPEYHNISGKIKSNVLSSVIQISRIFSIPNTALKIEPNIGFNFYYVKPKNESYEFHSDWQGNNAYNIDYIVLNVNEQRQTRFVPLLGMSINHVFSFGELGISAFVSSYYFNYRADFFTRNAYAFSTDDLWGPSNSFLGIGASYKIYLSK